MQRCEDNVAARLSGNSLQPLAGVQVTVTDDHSGLPASLYSDNGVTPLAQPIVTDDNGYYGFYAANGEYTLTFTGVRIATFTRKVTLQDPDDNPYATKAELAAGSGASLVTFTQAGAGAVPVDLQTLLRDAVSVRQHGAKGDGVTDDTAAIQAALDAHPVVVVPPGSYRIDGTLLPGYYSTLILEGDLIRNGTYSTSLRPVVKITKQRTLFLGRGGSVRTDNLSPEGMALMGSENPNTLPTQENILWSEIRGVRFSGVKDDASKGIVIQSTGGWGSGQAVYANTISDNFISNVGTGIYGGADANGNTFENNQFWEIKNYSYRFNGNDGSVGNQGVSDNTIETVFTHHSLTLLSSVKLENCSLNNFIGIHGEPGSGCLFDIDATSNGNTLIGTDNHPNASTDAGYSNTIMVNGRAKFGNATVRGSGQLVNIAGDTAGWYTLLSFSGGFSGLVLVRATGSAPSGSGSAWRSKLVHVGFTNWSWSGSSGKTAIVSAIEEAVGFCPEFNVRLSGSGASAVLQVQLLTAMGADFRAEIVELP